MDAKQQLELEIEQLKGKLLVMKHLGSEEDTGIKKKVEEISEELKDKIEEMEHIEALNQTLLVKERKSNDELQGARKELIVVCFLIPFGFHVPVFFIVKSYTAIYL